MRRRDLILWPLGIGGAAAAAVLMLRTDPLGVLKPCPLLALTGVPCPTCGGTQSLRSLLHADPGGAFLANPLIALVSILLVVSAVLALALLPWAHRLRGPRPARAWIWGALAALLVNWIYLIMRSR